MKIILAPGLALLLTLVAGCANSPGKPAAPPQTPEARAQSRWDALIGKDFVKAFEYLSPGARSELSPEAYASQMAVRPVRWKQAIVAGAECESEDACTVTVNIKFDVPSNQPSVGNMGTTAPVQERWIRLEGVWYHVPKHIALGR